MGTVPKTKFRGRPLTLDRMDSRSYLVQPEISPISSDSLTVSPSYSFGKDMSYANCYVSMDKSWRNNSFGSDVPLLLHNGNLSPVSMQNIPVCRPVHAGSLTQSNQIYGVGDLEHVHIEGMNRNNPRMYDYADYGHQYEELPGGRKSMGNFPRDPSTDSNSQYQSSGGATVMSDTEDTADIIKGSSDKRKRVNPLYDAMTQSVPSIYNKTKGSKEEKLRKQVCCLKCALIVVFVFCLASLAVSILTVITYMGSKDDYVPHHDSLSERIEKLSSDYSKLQDLLATVQGSNDTLEIMTNLIHKVSDVERNSSAHIGILQKQIDDMKRNVSQNSDTIDIVHTHLKVDVTNVNMSLQQQIDSVRKMEGPMGPQGVANFSRCTYYNVSNNSPASEDFPSDTEWAPTYNELQNSIAIFAACSVVNGDGHMIETNAIDSTMVQYRCICSGMLDPRSSRRYCYLHLLTCPRYS